MLPKTALSNLKKNDNIKQDDNEANDEDEDENCAVIGSKAENSLIDFPHAREHCVQYPFAKDCRKYCNNCFCLVCDIPARECKSWSSTTTTNSSSGQQQHCQANFTSDYWKRERELYKVSRSSSNNNNSGSSNSTTTTTTKRRQLRCINV